jgi:hypothetical protein
MVWEEMEPLFFAMKKIELENLDEEMMNDLLSAVDGVSNVLYRLEARRRKR